MKHLKLLIHGFFLTISIHASDSLTQTPFPIDTPIFTAKDPDTQARLAALESTHKTVYVYIWDRLQINQHMHFMGHVGLKLPCNNDYVSLMFNKSKADGKIGREQFRGMPQTQLHERLFWQRIKDAPIQSKAFIHSFEQDYDCFNAYMQKAGISSQSPRSLEALPAWVLPLHLTDKQYRKLQAAIEKARKRETKGKLFWSACGYKLEPSPKGLHFNCASFILWLLRNAGHFKDTTPKFFMPDNLKILLAKHLKQKLDISTLTLEQCTNLYTLKFGESETNPNLPPLITSARSLWQQRYAQISHSFHEWSKVFDSRSNVDCFDCYQPMYCKGLYQNIVTQLETKIKNEKQKKAFIIKGASGRGKTAMGKYLAYKTLQDEDSGYEVIQYIDVKTFGDLSPEVISKLQTKKCLLIVDNIDQHNCSQSQKLLMSVYKKLKKGIILILTKTKLDRSTIDLLSINCLPETGDSKDLDTAPLKPDESLQLFKASLIQTQSIPIYARRRFGDDEDIILGLFGVEKELMQELPQNPLDIIFTAHYIAKAGISLRDYIECRKDLNAGSVRIVKEDIDYQGQIIHERIASYISNASFNENQLKWLLTIGLIKGESIAVDKFLDGDTLIEFRQQLQDLGIIIDKDSAIKIGSLAQNLILKFLKPELTDEIIKKVLTKFKDYLEKKLNLKSREKIKQGQQHARSFIDQFWKLGDLDFVDSFHGDGLNTIANWEAFLNGIKYYKDDEGAWKIKLEKPQNPQVQKLLRHKLFEQVGEYPLDLTKVTHLHLSCGWLIRQDKEVLQEILSNFPNLKSLKLSGHSLGLEGFPQSGQSLSLRGNSLTSLEGIILPQSLQTLDLHGNSLTRLEGITLPQSLQYLDLRRNRLNTKTAGQLLRSLRRHKYLTSLDLGSSINLVDHIPEELTYLFGNTDIKLADGEVIIRFWLSHQESTPIYYVSLALPRYQDDGSVDYSQIPLHIGLTPPRDSKDMGRRIIKFAGSYEEDRQYYGNYSERLLRISGLDTKALIAKYRDDLINSEKSVDPENLRWAWPQVFITNPEEYLGVCHQHDSFSFAYGLLKYGGFDKLLFPAAFEHNPRLKIPMVFNEIKDYLFIYCWQLFTTPQLEAHALQPLFNLAPMELGGISRNQSSLVQSKSFIRGIQSGTFIDSSLKALFRVIEPCMRGTQIILPEVPDSLLLRVMQEPLPLATRPTASQFEHLLLPAPESISPQITTDQAAQLIADGKQSDLERLREVDLDRRTINKAKRRAIKLLIPQYKADVEAGDFAVAECLVMIKETVDEFNLGTSFSLDYIRQLWLQPQI